MQICSAVQLSGFFLCLLGAARITHRAQGIVSIATRWHMTATSTSVRSEQGKGQMPEAGGTLAPKSGDSDSDSSDIFMSISSLDPSSSFQARQALGKSTCVCHLCWCLQFNPNVSFLPWLLVCQEKNQSKCFICSGILAAQQWRDHSVWICTWSRIASHTLRIWVLFGAVDSE